MVKNANTSAVLCSRMIKGKVTPQLDSNLAYFIKIKQVMLSRLSYIYWLRLWPKVCTLFKKPFPINSFLFGMLSLVVRSKVRARPLCWRYRDNLLLLNIFLVTKPKLFCFKAERLEVSQCWFAEENKFLMLTPIQFLTWLKFRPFQSISPSEKIN